MLTPEQLTLVVLKVGENPEQPGTLASIATTIASQYAGLDLKVGALGPGYSLEMLYTERDLIRVALGGVWSQVDQGDVDLKMAKGQRTAHLQSMLNTVQGEMVRIEKLVRSSGAPLVGNLTQTTPEPDPIAGTISADDVSYRGSPYYPYSGGPNLGPLLPPSGTP